MENYKRYGLGGPRKIVDPKWVRELPKDDGQWTMEQAARSRKYAIRRLTACYSRHCSIT